MKIQTSVPYTAIPYGAVPTGVVFRFSHGSDNYYLKTDHGHVMLGPSSPGIFFQAIQALNQQCQTYPDAFLTLKVLHD